MEMVMMDVVIGSHNEYPQGRRTAGESYILFGKEKLFNIDLELLFLTEGIKIQGANIHDNSGWPVSGAGDVNCDGYYDIIIGARYASPLGGTNARESYLLFGKAKALKI